MDLKPTTRRNFLGLALGVPAAAALAACGGTAPTQTGAGGGAGAPSASGGGGGGAATYWYLSGPPGEAIRDDTVNDCTIGTAPGVTRLLI